VARDDAGPLSSNLDTLFGRSRSAFSSRLHARVLPRLTTIGPLRNSRIQRGVRKTVHRLQLQHWHNPWMGIFGSEVPTLCIDSTVSSSSATTLSRVAHSQPVQ
jgi:hypothetical protein